MRTQEKLQRKMKQQRQKKKLAKGTDEDKGEQH